MCRSIRAENLSHFGFNTYDMLVQEFTKAPFDTFSEGDVHMLWYLYSSSDWTSWQVTGGFFSLFGISWKCAQIITSCLTFIRQGTFPLKRTWLYGVFVYMKIHASIKFNFAIFVVFKLQVWGFWRGINNSFPFHLEWFKKKKLCQSLSGKVKFCTIERNYWNTGDPYLLGWLLFYVFVKKPQKNSKHLLYAKKSYVRWYAADQGS